MATRGKVQAGDIVQISLGDGNYSYGYVLAEPLVAFLDHRDLGDPPDLEALIRGPVAFTIWVSNQPLTDESWPVIGHVDPSPRFQQPIPFFKQDAISKKLSITYDGSEDIKATRDECRALERAAVWAPEHIIDRLRDHFAGQPNHWVESLRLV